MIARRRAVRHPLVVLLLWTLLLVVLGAAPATAAPEFPKLTGRVVDAANILPPATEGVLTSRLAALETSTGRQLVVATVPSLGGYEVEEYGYQLGRAWAIGQEKADDGAILLVAPNEKRVRIEVGYGLEGELTDALSSTIIQTRILPRFREGDFPGGIVAGTDALVELLSLPEGELQARATAAEARPVAGGEEDGVSVIVIILVIFFVLWLLSRGGRRGRRRRRGVGGALLDGLIWAAANSSSGGGSSSSGGFGGFSGGGGGFSGGGGSFGGGGASGRW